MIAGGLALYALLLGVGLFTHIVRPERAFLLIAAPCFVPMLRYAFDYRQNRGERDSGLLLSAVGWFLIILALTFKQIAVIQAGGNLAALPASSPLVPICATFGVLCLLTGAVFSWLFWAASEEVAEPPASAHY